VDRLLEVSRASTGKLRLDLEDVDLAALVRDSVASMAEEATAARAPITVTGADLPILGRWDASRLDQALKNLLSNAIKYGAGHAVAVGVEADEERARVTVADGGIGIRPEDQARIFERYERAVRDEFGGLGVGLWITREIVSALDGTIRVESQPRYGATFSVELPRRGPS
jgi:signal transduction histidine kinase